MANEHKDCGAWEKQEKLDLILGGMGVCLVGAKANPAKRVAKFLVKNLVAHVLANTGKYYTWKWACQILVTAQFNANFFVPVQKANRQTH